MAVTKTSLANEALTEIGSGLITSLTEDSEPARILNAVFDAMLDEEVAKGNWTFATARAELAPLSETPAFGWTYQFQLPTDCLRVLEEVDGNDYRKEGRRLLADESVLRIKYIRRVTDLNDLSADFRRAFVYRLAAKLAIPLVGSRELRESMLSDYATAVAHAESMDAMQEPADEQAEGSWLDARGGE